MKRLPSVKTLRDVFGEQAKEARKVLEMTREELEAHPVGKARCAECFHPPSDSDLVLNILNKLCNGHGVEGFKIREGFTESSYCNYINMGDTYAATLCYVESFVFPFYGKYVVSSWGDMAEKYNYQN